MSRLDILGKKIIILALTLPMCLALTSCMTDSSGNAEATSEISIVTTGFPEYDWTRELLGEAARDVNVTMLLSSGVDMHSFQPSAQDIIAIKEADMFVYGGGESEDWVEDVLRGADGEKLLVNLMEASGKRVLEEETLVQDRSATELKEEGPVDDTAGSAYDDGADAPTQDRNATAHAGEVELDEHVWLSPKNAMLCCRGIRDKLILLLPEREDEIERNYERYEDELKALDEELTACTAGPWGERIDAAAGEHKRADSEKMREGVDASGSGKPALIFCDRFPFRYLTEDYGIEYYAAFPGCSTESNASFETILFLADKVDETGAHAVIVLDDGAHDIADTVIDNTARKDAGVLELDSMQTVSLEEAESGKTYIGIMRKNISVIAEALAVN